MKERKQKTIPITTTENKDNISVNLAVKIKATPPKAKSDRKVANPNTPLKNDLSSEKKILPTATEPTYKSNKETGTPMKGDFTIIEFSIITIDNTRKRTTLPQDRLLAFKKINRYHPID